MVLFIGKAIEQGNEANKYTSTRKQLKLSTKLQKWLYNEENVIWAEYSSLPARHARSSCPLELSVKDI